MGEERVVRQICKVFAIPPWLSVQPLRQAYRSGLSEAGQDEAIEDEVERRYKSRDRISGAAHQELLAAARAEEREKVAEEISEWLPEWCNLGAERGLAMPTVGQIAHQILVRFRRAGP